MRKTLSEYLRDITKEVLDTKTSNMSNISAMLFSPSDPTFSIEIEDLQTFIIDQLFADIDENGNKIQGRYTDLINISFTLSLTEYINVIKVYRDLRCSIMIVGNNNKNKDYSINPPISIDQKIIFDVKDDLFKTMNKSDITDDTASLRTEEQQSRRISVDAQLIDDQLYEVRKKQLSFNARDTTIERVLHYIVGQYEPDFKCIIKPDNDTEYKVITIPGMKSFDTIFKYLHDKFGIYDTGLGYYWSEKTLYIYPLYNHTPENSPQIVNIYFIGGGTITGGSNYHIEKQGIFHIISNQASKSIQLTEKGTENQGNGFMVQRDSLIFDKWREQDELGMKIIKDGLVRMQLDNPNTMSQYSHNMRFVYGENNVSKCKGSLSLINGTLTTIGWEHAVPFIIKPGWKVVYHYDGKDTYEYKNASPIRARYTYSCVGRDGNARIYSCYANVTLFTES